MADIRINIDGVNDELRANVLAFLSVERYRDRDDLDEDTMTRLANRIDDEVRSALRPFGYYEPMVRSDFTPDKRLAVSIVIEPGPAIQVEAVSIEIEGAGSKDSEFTALSDFPLLLPGRTLNHGSTNRRRAS